LPLTILVALNLNDHLLQAPDELLAPLLGHLALEVVLGLLADLLGLLLVVLVHVGGGGLLEVFGGGGGASTRVDLRGALLLVLGGALSGSSWVGRAVRVGSLGGILACALNILLADGNARLDLTLEVILGKVRGLVPDVVLGGSVDVLELVL
jgi:hypothetical protein